MNCPFPLGLSPKKHIYIQLPMNWDEILIHLDIFEDLYLITHKTIVLLPWHSWCFGTIWSVSELTNSQEEDSAEHGQRYWTEHSCQGREIPDVGPATIRSLLALSCHTEAAFQAPCWVGTVTNWLMTIGVNIGIRKESRAVLNIFHKRWTFIRNNGLTYYRRAEHRVRRRFVWHFAWNYTKSKEYSASPLTASCGWALWHRMCDQWEPGIGSILVMCSVFWPQRHVTKWRHVTSWPQFALSLFHIRDC